MFVGAESGIAIRLMHAEESKKYNSKKFPGVMLNPPTPPKLFLSQVISLTWHPSCQWVTKGMPKFPSHGVLVSGLGIL